MADPWRPFNKFVSSSCVTLSFMFSWHRVPSVFSLPRGAAQGRDEPNLDSVLVLLLTGCVSLCLLVCVPSSSSLTGFIGGLNELMNRGLNDLVNSWLNEWVKLILSTVSFPHHSLAKICLFFKTQWNGHICLGVLVSTYQELISSLSSPNIILYLLSVLWHILNSVLSCWNMYFSSAHGLWAFWGHGFWFCWFILVSLAVPSRVPYIWLTVISYIINWWK